MKSTQIVLLLLAITNVARAADITPAEVFRKLGERSERFETFAIEWTSSEWYAAGSKSLPSRQPQTGTDDPLPAQDVEFAGRASLTVSGSSLLSRRRAYDWIPHKQSFVARDFVEFTNGKDSLLFASPIAADEPSMATLKQGAPSHIINLNHIAAVILALRPVHAGIGRYDKHSAWNVSPSSGVIEGAACLIVERIGHAYSRDPSSFDSVTRLWIDPEMDYAIRRSTTGTPGHVLDQLDIQYRRDGSFGWLPDGWVQQTISVRIRCN